MEYIKNRFYEAAMKKYDEYMKLKNEYSDVVVGKVTIGHVLSGMKGVPSLLTETSKLDPNEGIRFRGISLKELRKTIPRLCEHGEPLPEGLFYLMLIGEIPELDDISNISKDWATRAIVPAHVFEVIDAMPKNARPMAQFVAAITSMASESYFLNAHQAGVQKKYYWDTTYEDVMNLIARLPRVAAYIYRRTFHKGEHIDPDPRLDWAGNFAHMMGFSSPPHKRLMRMYMSIHADHEGGNVSAHTTHLVGSTLSNPYYAYAAGMLGLAGPLHGFANQNVLSWIIDMIRDLGDDDPSQDRIRKYCKKFLDQGGVIPGFGHAVLRITDPRYDAQKEFAEKFIKSDNLINIVNKLYNVVPPLLEATGKVKNPWPNVDAYSGALLRFYGIKEHNFYTVMFGVSRALGVLSSLLFDRVFGLPIERPTSYPLQWYRDVAEGKIKVDTGRCDDSDEKES
jgi:citrate synthase